MTTDRADACGAADPRWQAVVARRAPAEGEAAFVYAVTTTGIYCRPGCPARRPRRDNVVFFPGPGAARAAGFRPCRRCRPDEPAGAAQAAAVAQARHRLETAESEPTLAALAAEAGLSAGHFQRLFRAAVGLTPKGYARAVRAGRLCDALTQGQTVTEAIHAAGYGGPARAHAESHAVLGMTPSAWRRGGAGETVDHVLADSHVGRVMVAATARGLCWVAFGDDDAALLAGLRARVPNATLRTGGAAAQAVLPAVLALLADGTGPAADLPLDLRGTVFQQRVWAALRRIPAGETRTYAEIAAALGQPQATRAVAGACAANPVAVVVPCHRVVRSDGGLGGYRWGVARKRRLLAREAGEG